MIKIEPGGCVVAALYVYVTATAAVGDSLGDGIGVAAGPEQAKTLAAITHVARRSERRRPTELTIGSLYPHRQLVTVATRAIISVSFPWRT